MKATLDKETRTVNIQQEFTYNNTAQDTLKVLYFNDWAHAYADKNTALAKRFAEDFKKSLHLAKDRNRGSTEIFSMLDEDYRSLTWDRQEDQIDIVRVVLQKPIPPGVTQRFVFTYSVKLPPNRYTPYGYDPDGGYYLKDWYLTPAIYDGGWQRYSNKNLEDLYTGITDTNIFFTYPEGLDLGTNFNEVNITEFPDKNYATLSGVNRKSCDIILNAKRTFTKHVTPNLVVVTDIDSKGYDEISQGVSINRITRFISENLGPFPYEQLLVSEIDF
ncbi:MAG: metalloprotease, partial [Eudoraea sp.]|nr:metalloprotease [Eudoraea sp.]